MSSRVMYGQLRTVLTALGFKEKRRATGVAFEHRPSDTLLLLRAYEAKDRLQSAEVTFVRKQLDERGLLEPESFETLLTRAPA